MAKKLRWIVLSITLFALIWSLRPATPSGNGSWITLETLPVMSEGRVKPLDSVARQSLLFLSGRQTLKTPSGNVMAIAWLMRTLSGDPAMRDVPLIRIENPEVVWWLGLPKSEGSRYAIRDLGPKITLINDQHQRLKEIPDKERSPFQREASRLYEKLLLALRLEYTFRMSVDQPMVPVIRTYEAVVERSRPFLSEHMQFSDDHAQSALRELTVYFSEFRRMASYSLFLPLRPVGGQLEWVSMGTGLLDILAGRPLHPDVLRYASLMDAYQAGEWTIVNREAGAILTDLAHAKPKVFQKVKMEVMFNNMGLFYKASLVYGLVFILLVLSWLRWQAPLYNAAMTIAVVAMSLQWIGILMRMVIDGRPPVTNLYSSAVFVGGVAAVLAWLMEKRFKNGISLLAGSILAVSTLIIAHQLGLQSDPMPVMQAVLDSNFWLSTHVICICIGYSATFLAGLFSVIALLRGTLTASLTPEIRRSTARMVYATVCFALLFSFVGTVLGGIWADQSWGRFWGWDPKENGALLIVLWNAIILHTRMTGRIRERGLFVMAVVGNIVTAFSWFGVNMLGVGLHSYGFTDKSFLWLVGFIFSQLAIIVVGLLPTRLWASRQHFQ
ncbi:MAG: cytochrome c biogenesis protein CcsA [Candidatus Margulisiibacteriota bacterium]